jgi:hypothetical protein
MFRDHILGVQARAEQELEKSQLQDRKTIDTQIMTQKNCGMGSEQVN